MNVCDGDMQACYSSTLVPLYRLLMFVLSNTSCLLFAALLGSFTAGLEFAKLLPYRMLKLCYIVRFIGSSCLFCRGRTVLSLAAASNKGLDLFPHQILPVTNHMRRTHLRTMQKSVLWLCWQLAGLNTPRKQCARECLRSLLLTPSPTIAFGCVLISNGVIPKSMSQRP